SNDQWLVDNNYTYTAFTPAADDCLVANLDFDNNTATTLEGTSGAINGIDSGYVIGDLVVIPEQLAGNPNAGEFDVTGTFIGDNAPPVANDDADTTPEDTPVTTDVTANDTDVDGTIDPTSVTEVTAPSNGTISIDLGTGEITYTPDLTFNGIDTYEYSVCDDDGACDTATVTITVTAAS
ncbi:MAG: cadherin-like domain-containing protein, partial [Acidimicrobiia bacterium]|nr:cadherin-like domain-containing protein [Acidimicrobiia bacterium]